jgi:hypothetical protein
MSCASVPGNPNSIGIQIFKVTCASWTVVIVELKALTVDEETTKIPTAGTFRHTIELVFVGATIQVQHVFFLLVQHTIPMRGL